MLNFSKQTKSNRFDYEGCFWSRLNYCQANKAIFGERFGFDNHKMYARKTISVALPIHSTASGLMQSITSSIFLYAIF